MKRCLMALVALGALAYPASAKNPVVVIKTSHGIIKVELFEKDAPKTVANFLKYVDDKHFDDTVFHRVMVDFMIQGGGFKKGFTDIADIKDHDKFRNKTRDPIKNESTNDLSNKRGTIAMARTGEPDSATDQFYINVVDNDKLDRAQAEDKVGYCVFGKVIDGMSVVDKIRKVETKTILKGAFKNVPAKEVVIESIRREDSK